jgi:ligand-binding sensor domain-containing protein
MKKFVFCISMLAACLACMQAKAQWQQTTAPAGNSVACLLAHNTNILAGTAGGGIIMSSDSGATWITQNTGISNLNIKALGADTSGNLYAGTNSLVLYTSGDTANNWTSRNAGGTGTAISSIAAYGTNVFLGEVGDGVFKSVNSGVSWAEVGLCCASVLSLCSDLNGYVYAGTNTSVYRSSGAFTNWTQMNNGFPSNSVRAIVKSGSMIFSGTYGNGVFVTANNGTSWTQVNMGLTDLHVISLAANDSKIFAGTVAGGVFVSVNHGLSWIQVNENLSYLNIPSLAICGSFVYAGTTHGGIWKRSLSEFTTIKEIQSYSGLVVYPNPASENITVRVDCNMEPNTKLNIYDVFGALVKSELLNQSQTEMHMGDFKNGIYVLEIKNKDYTEKQKIVIQR